MTRHCLFALLLVLIVIPAVAAQEVDRPLVAAEPKDEFAGRPIARLEFRGNQRFSSETLLRQFRYVKVGDSWHKEKLKIDLDRLRVLHYAERGYLRARFGEPQIEDDGAGLRVTIPVEEGVCYRFGAILVEDAMLFTPEQVLQIIGVQPGEIVKAYSVVNKGLERLEEAYEEQGYVQMECNFIPEFMPTTPGAQEGIVDLTLSVFEGVPYTISRIEFSGNVNMNDSFLRERLLIREGDLYNKKLFDKSLRRLRELGLDVSEEDVECHTDEKTGQVRLVFRLENAPKSPPQLFRSKRPDGAD